MKNQTRTVIVRRWFEFRDGLAYLIVNFKLGESPMFNQEYSLVKLYGETLAPSSTKGLKYNEIYFPGQQEPTFDYGDLEDARDMWQHFTNLGFERDK